MAPAARGAPTSTNRWAEAAVAAAVTTGILLGGCQARALEPGPQEALRDENRRLRDENRALSGQVAELESKLAEAEAARTGGPVDPEVLAHTPTATRLELKSGSVVEPVAGEPGRGIARVWLEPVDGRGRFVQVTGWMEVGITALPPSGPAVPIGSVRLGPAEVREAYRAGFMGTHYAIEVPVRLDEAGPTPHFAVAASFTDGRSGATLTTAGTARRLEPARVAGEASR